MQPRTPTAQWRPRLQRRLLPLILAVFVLLPATTAKAALPAAATGTVSIDFRTTFMFPCPSCQLAVSGTSAGDVAGVDGTGTAYEVIWPATATIANFTGNIYYTTACAGVVPEVSNIDNASSITVSNAELVYGAAHTPATVTFTFGGSISGGTEVVAGIASMTIGNGVISIAFVPKSGGVLHVTPVTPVGACLNSTQQGYEITGTMLAAQP